MTRENRVKAIVKFDVEVASGAIMTKGETEQVIYRMTITVKGRVIRRPDGKPFRIVLRSKQAK